MDNLTHTLIGLVAAEAVARHAPRRDLGLPDATRRTTLLAMGMAGGNLPDVDLLWSMPALTGDPLDYLVHHRGHTHTILGCIGLALVLFAGAVAALRWRGHALQGAGMRLLAAMALLAVMLHLGMDALNVYGVHPFWPWDARWYYGDSVFIVEPLYWLSVAPLLLTMRSRPARVLLGLVLVAGCIAVLAFHRFGAAWWGIPLLAGALVAAGGRLAPGAASRVAVGVPCAVTAVFTLAHAAASHRVEQLSLAQFPGARTIDTVLSPAPAHPLCWDVMLLQAEGRHYVARLGQLDLSAGSRPPCARSLNTAGTAPLRNMNRPVVAGMRWSGEYTMDIGELSRLATSTCEARRLASFLRAPFAARSAQGWIVGDLRFDRERETGFAELVVAPGPSSACRPAPWRAPRADLGF